MSPETKEKLAEIIGTTFLAVLLFALFQKEIHLYLVFITATLLLKK
jgi:uncharacterized membrane protein YdfJ with MMPL/SSD domain